MTAQIRSSQIQRQREPRVVDVACPQCQANECRSVAQFRKAREPHPWKVVACARCGLMYTSPRPSADDWDLWYDEDYSPHQLRDKRPSWHSQWRRRWRQRFPEGFRDPYLLAPTGGGRLLDLGCGTGKYVWRMQGLGWRGLGVEPSERAAALARNVYGVAVVRGQLPGVELKDESFDLATAWQVLEHLESPRETLAAVRRLLAPDGRLAVTVPNQDGDGAHWFGADWIGLDLPRHLTHFTASTLRAMLESEGFEVLTMRTLSQSGWLRHSAKRIPKEDRNRRQSAAGDKIPSRFLSAWSTYRGRGESLYAVARPVGVKR